MPRITSLEPQKHDPERVNVFVDGQFSFGASVMLVAARRLKEGRDLAAEEIDALRQDDAVDRAYSATLNFLSFRPRSRGEIEEYFRRKKLDSGLLEPVLQRLDRLALIDDREFARFWIENRQTFRPRGTRALRSEMWQKGLEREIIDEALEGLEELEDDSAYRAGLKKIRSYRSLDEVEFRRRMIGFLQRRGFPYSATATATSRLWEEREHGDDDLATNGAES